MGLIQSFYGDFHRAAVTATFRVPIPQLAHPNTIQME
jgi:hypothetical protein